MNIKVVGLGGIGSDLVHKLVRYLCFSVNDSTIRPVLTLIDGDIYERNNMSRQECGDVFGLTKANAQKQQLVQKFGLGKVVYNDLSVYLTDENIHAIIQDNDIVFLAVDNYKTRSLVAEYMEELDNIIVISGGNDLVDGSVQISIKQNGEFQSPRLTDYHPELRNPKDKLPTELSCEEQAYSAPQIYFTNVLISTLMCCVFYNIINNTCLDKLSVIYADICKLLVIAQCRNPKD